MFAKSTIKSSLRSYCGFIKRMFLSWTMESAISLVQYLLQDLIIRESRAVKCRKYDHHSLEPSGQSQIDNDAR